MVFLEEAPVTIGRAKHHDSDNRGTTEVACGRATATAIFHWARAVIDTAYCACCANRTILFFTFLTCPHRIVFFDDSLFWGYLRRQTLLDGVSRTLGRSHHTTSVCAQVQFPRNYVMIDIRLYLPSRIVGWVACQVGAIHQLRWVPTTSRHAE